MLVAKQLERGDLLRQLDADVTRRFSLHQLNLQRRIDPIIQFVDYKLVLNAWSLWNRRPNLLY